ncbi:hypothetical protein [Halopseudomonas oceani]|uniref:hypothetical protein n=1 Tax=Halopseudomonas oceani TaxID=1708783 RepID=UPI000C8A865A|nr:hypothetical protein [Halopseudomonas oceani]MAC99695.1 hypothetical protein [Pseudomonadales bacterium]|tara:strand:+ start:39951 stop:40331 length:381 start_codon:yes stop_codon:yes gene_type:complete
MMKHLPTNPAPLINHAIGAIKLLQLHLDHPTAINAREARAAGTEAVQRLQQLDDTGLRLAEALNIAASHFPYPLSVSVGMAGQRYDQLQVIVSDGNHIMHTISAKTVDGLRELLGVNAHPARSASQ